LKKSRFSDEQIAHALRQSEAGTPVAEITRKLGVSEATFYAWKKKFGSMGTAEIRELRQLREENLKLKRLVADLSLDKTMLQDVRIEWLPVVPCRRSISSTTRGVRKRILRDDWFNASVLSHLDYQLEVAIASLSWLMEGSAKTATHQRLEGRTRGMVTYEDLMAVIVLASPRGRGTVAR
jgi:putative transposase